MEDSFSELPASLVEEMLSKSDNIGEDIINDFINTMGNREEMRGQLENLEMLKHDSQLRVVTPPTVCGIDGSYAIERLLSTDMVAVAAVSVEGLTPPQETRYWEEPYHQLESEVISHNEHTSSVARGLMILLEYQLATEAPHDAVLTDGSFTTPIIYLNQAITKLDNFSDSLKAKFLKNLEDGLNSYKEALESGRTDRIWAALPKYSVKKEIKNKLDWDCNSDDKAILTKILKPGEYTKPTKIEPPSQDWHLALPNGYKDLKEVVNNITTLLNDIYIVYYRPRAWSPALRIEMSSAIAHNKNRLSVLISAIKRQIVNSQVMEPYPLYMADIMVKHIGGVMPAYRQIITRKMAENYSGDLMDVFFTMHGYRTDLGR